MNCIEHSANNYNKLFFKFYSDVSYIIMTNGTTYKTKIKYSSDMVLQSNTLGIQFLQL